ncbi:hypothetical protein [Streptomyces sp. NPDC087300]|uniref:hypothetical protein n=1 Tax=Streptomyces sp. NPDC087300 TaxID=3365780 RepID=UPI00382C115E
MNSAPHLLNEDRTEYERVLDEALSIASERADPAVVGQRLNTEQLRTMAQGAAGLITAAAASEYEHYVRLREAAAGPTAEHAEPNGLGRRFGAAVVGAGQPGVSPVGDGVAPQRWAGMSYGRRLAAAVLGLHVRPETPSAPVARTPRPTAARLRRVGPPRRAAETDERAGAGVFGVIVVVVLVLAGCAAVLSLLTGSILKLLDPTPGIADVLVTVGWAFGALTVASLVVAVVGLLVTAVREGSTPSPADEAEAEGEDEEVALAREAWRAALLDRGILPFLRDALEDPDLDVPRQQHEQGRSVGRIPQLGYTRPDFLGPLRDAGGPGTRPSFSSPDFTSPDFGGPEPDGSE